MFFPPERIRYLKNGWGLSWGETDQLSVWDILPG
jgi:hypothetical protein